MSNIKSKAQPSQEDVSIDAMTRFFAHLEELIVAAEAANDTELSKSLKQGLSTSLEQYYDTQRGILEAKIKAASKRAT